MKNGKIKMKRYLKNILLLVPGFALIVFSGCKTVEEGNQTTTEITTQTSSAQTTTASENKVENKQSEDQLEIKRNLSRGYEAFKRSNYEEAEKYFNAVVEKDPENIKAAYYLAEIYFNTNRLEESLQKFQFVIDNEKEPKRYSKRALNRQAAIISQNREDIDKLLQVYIEIIKNNPDDIDARLRVAAMYEMQGNTDEAIKYYKEVHTIAPDDIASSFHLGKLLYKKEDYKSAIDIFRSIVDQNPNDAEAMYFIALCYKKTGNYTQAENYFKNVLEIQPDYPNAAMYLGDIYKKQKLYSKMVRTYEQLLSKEPNNIKFLNQISIGLIESGNLDKAEIYINKALKINPYDGETMVRKGELLEARGDRAKKAFEKQKCKRFGKQANKYFKQAGEAYSAAVTDPQMGGFASSKLDIVEQKKIPDEDIFFAKDC